jgi:hypothetical protein
MHIQSQGVLLDIDPKLLAQLKEKGGCSTGPFGGR